jgi:hypothetical protein
LEWSETVAGQRELSVVASSVTGMKDASGSAADGCDSALLDAPPPDPFATDSADGADFDDFDDDAFWEQRGCSLVPAAESGRCLVDAALAAVPGAVYAGVLAGLDPDVLDGETRVDLIRAWQRVAAWVDAQQQVALASVVAATEDAGLTGDDARHEVGVALRLSPGSAYDTVQRAAALTGRLADTLGALRRGEISGLQATTIAKMVEPLDDEIAAAVQAAVLATAPEQTLAETKRTLRRAVIAADPAGAAHRAEQARAGRTVSRDPLEDGMAEMRAVLTAADTELVWAELTARAQAEHIRRHDHGLPQPGLDALRADALVDAVLGTHPDSDTADTDTDDTGSGSSGRTGGPGRVQLRVTIDLPTLLGLADNPAELAGHGPIAPDLARQLAGDADWIRFTTDPQTGELLDLAPRRYRPSRRLAAFIRARQPVCTWPGCNQPSERCDIDHSHDFGKGGPTCRCNLGPFCRQHHNAKTHGRWRYRRDHDGTGHLTSPLRKTYRLRPPWRRANQ